MYLGYYWRCRRRFTLSICHQILGPMGATAGYCSRQNLGHWGSILPRCLWIRYNSYDIHTDEVSRSEYPVFKILF